MQAALVYFHCKGAELTEVIPPLFVLEGNVPTRVRASHITSCTGRREEVEPLIPLLLAPIPSEAADHSSQK